jgi:dihydropteroate synthase
MAKKRTVVRVREIKRPEEAERAFKKLGVHSKGVSIMTPKAVFKCLEIKGLTPVEAGFLKQGILSKGGECALPMQTFKTNSKGQVDAILMGTHYQLRNLLQRLKDQPWGLKDLPGMINDAVKNYEARGYVLLKTGKKMTLGKRTRIMGVINVTPDSFSDEGKFFGTEEALKQGVMLAKQGADILDVGGESTRPFSDPVTIDEELKRVIPVIRKLSKKVKVPISIDSYHTEVVQKALKAGASIVNDVNGLRTKGMAELVARAKVPIVIMHMKGTPKTMQKKPRYSDCIGEIYDFLTEKTQAALDAGVKPERIIIDPGIGFGKRVEDNLVIIKRLGEFRSMGYPVLLGASRKSFIGALTGQEVDQRLHGSLGSVAAGVMNGADIVRVHDVLETKRTIEMVDHIRNVKEE